MDKLKPLLVHKFWIILFIALLLPVIGWSMATGSLAKEIEERTTKIDGAFKASQIGPNPPNQTWSTALKEINENKKSYIGQSNKMLWETQKELFVWPSRIAVLMKDTPYRGEISFVPRNFYRSDYKVELLRVHKLANPFNLQDGTGLVDFSPNVIPHVPFKSWVTTPPTSEEMWDAQEDVWLLTSIVKAIAAVNKGTGAKNIGESAIRQISALQLRGGTIGGSAQDSQDGFGAGAEAGFAEGGMPGGPGAFGAGRGGMLAGGDAMGGTKTIDVDIDLTEIFGNDVDTSAAPGGGEGADMDMDASAGAFPGGMPGGIGGASQKLIRYYDDTEELPYKTRVFYIKVVMESTKLPNLLSELTKMPWPVEIKRVQVADLLDDNLNPLAASGGGGMGGRGQMMGRDGADDFGLDAGIGGGAGQPGFIPAEGGIIGGDQGRGNNEGLRKAAVNEAGLAVVSIAGLMTLYKPYPPLGENVTEAEGNDGNPGQQPTSDPAATQPTDSATGTAEPAATPSNDTSTNPTTNSQNAPVTNPEKNPAVPSEVKPNQPTGAQPTDPKPNESQSPESDSPKTDNTVKQ